MNTAKMSGPTRAETQTYFLILGNEYLGRTAGLLMVKGVILPLSLRVRLLLVQIIVDTEPNRMTRGVNIDRREVSEPGFNCPEQHS